MKRFPCKSQCVKPGRSDYFFKYTEGNKGLMIPPKAQNKALITDPKLIEIYELPNKEFKIIILKELSELQENTDKLNKIGKTIHEQNEKLNQEKQ